MTSATTPSSQVACTCSTQKRNPLISICRQAWVADDMWPLRPPVDRPVGVPSTSGRTAAQEWVPSGSTRATCRCCVTTRAAKNGQQQQVSRRNAQLYELSDEDGWGVEVVAPTASNSKAHSNTSSKASAVQQTQPAAAAAAPKGRQRGTPFVDIRSEQGVLGLTLLHKVLLDEEAQQSQGQATDHTASLAAVKEDIQQSAKGIRKSKIPGYPSGSAAAAVAALKQQQQQQQRYEDYDEDEDEEAAGPEFQITFDKGKTEFTDLSSGSTSSSTTAAAADSQQLEDSSMSGWGGSDASEQQQQHEEEEEEDEQTWQQPQQQLYLQQSRSGKSKAPSSEVNDIDDAVEASLLADLSNEDDWGLESLMNPATSSISRRQRSLVDQLSQQESAKDGFEEGSLAADGSGSVRWGGTAGTTGIDMEEQEELLRRYFRPDQVKKLMKDQVEIDVAYSDFKKRAIGLGVNDHKTQETLRIVSGTAAGKKLLSFRSKQTRPMMEKVRQAIFNIIQSQAGTINSLPQTARWLDLFAGTGSVGLEALSRGAREVHFVEMDSAVVHKILSRNINTCGFKSRATCHTTKAEDFLRRAIQLPRFAGGPFDFISVCPPYLLVSYPELYDLLDRSPLIYPGSTVFVEYPKQLSKQVRDSLGPLQRVKDRKYGRTYVAVYAGADSAVEDEVDDDPFLNL